ncbi:MAG: hypothetical protein ABI406_00950 [Ktedonobacteraceae bacterium]
MIDKSYSLPTIIIVSGVSGEGILKDLVALRHRQGTGVPVNGDALAVLAHQLKKLCGTGGTFKDGTIEIQGDHCDKVQAKLTEMGYKVKRAGG